jgi:putative ABC transport system permease protein
MRMLLYGVRRFLQQLRREPGIAAAIVVVCGLTAGAVGLAVDLSVRAFHGPSRSLDTGGIVRIESMDRRQGAASDNAAPDVLEARSALTTVRHAAGYFTTDYNLTVQAAAVPIRVTFASADIWPLAGVAPLHGTTFGPPHDRPGGDVRKVVLGHGLWMTAWGGDRGVVGRTVTLGLATYEVLGVMPEGFAFPDRADAWVPLEAWFAYLGTTSATIARGGRAYGAVARMAEGAGVERVQQDLDRLSADLARAYPATNEHLRLVATPYSLRASSGSRPFITAALAASALLWGTALAAMAAIGGVRHARRQRVTAVHLALGARRRHLLAAALGEAVTPALASVVLAMLVANALSALLVGLIPGVHPLWLERGVGGAALAMTALLAAATSAVSALWSSRWSLPQLLPLLNQRSTWPRSPLSARLAAAQLALAASLGIAGLSFAHNVVSLTRVQPGFSVGNGVAVYLSPPGDDIAPGQRVSEYSAIYDRVLDNLREEPGILSAGAVNVLPLVARSGFQRSTVTADGQTPEAQAGNPVAGVLRASSGYFDAMGIPLLAGREFNGGDRADTLRVAILSESLAARLWPGAPAVGQRLKLGNVASTSPWATVIAVAGDVRSAALGQPPGADVYFSYRQVIAGEAYVVVRSQFGEGHALAAAERAVRRASPHVAVFRRTTLPGLVADSLWQERLSGAAIGILGLAALAVAGVTIYGTAAVWLAASRREFAVRVALGADGPDILQRILTRAAEIALPAAIGCAALTAVAGLALDRVLTNPAPAAATCLGGMLLAVAVVALAVAGPARSALRDDPAAALRAE